MNNKGSEHSYWIALQQAPGLGPQRLLKLVEHFGSAEAVWEAKEEELLNLPWMGKAAQELIAWRKKVEPARVGEEFSRLKVGILVFTDPGYPQELKSIYNPPPVLYYLGDLAALEGIKVAVVGTRRPTPYGLKVAHILAQGLAEAGIIVVSGLAIGIDAAAHRGALQGKGKTIAVLGSGVDVIYPRENARLYQEISREGLLLSEFPPGTPPERYHFPARNRIISGLARGTVVVEAGEKSGALITADLALEQGRDVFAVPGPITSPQSKGTNNLLKQGAKIVTGVEDILEEYFPVEVRVPTLEAVAGNLAGFKLSPIEEKVLAAVASSPLSLEEIGEATGLSTQEINVALTFLELQGLILRLPGGLYLRSFPGD